MKDLSSKIKRLNDDIKISNFSIVHDAYDELLFGNVVKNNPRIAKAINDGKLKYKPFTELYEDLFCSLYKYVPEKTPDGHVHHEYLLNSEIMDEIIATQKYKELRNLTRLDALASTVGSEVLGDNVRELIDKLKDKFDDLVQAYGASKKGDSTDEEGTDGKNNEEITYEEAKRRLAEFKKKVHELITPTERKAIGRMMENAVNEAQATSDMIANWGLEASDSYVKGEYQDKLAILERLRKSEKLKQIANLAGRYKRLAIQTQREKVKKGMDEVYDVVPGNDLGRLLASEKMKLMHPLTKLLFMKDYLESKTLQYQTNGKEKKHKGPVVILLDDSGSMSGLPEVWAKSVALGVLEICRIQKRDLFIVHFNSNPKEMLHCNYFPKNEYKIEDVLDMAEYFSGGGTFFEPPLELAQDKIMTMKEFTKADILMVTDGDAAVGDDWLEKYLKWKKDKNVNITSILIDCGHHTEVCVKTFSDKIEHLNTIRKGSADDLAISLFMNI